MAGSVTTTALATAVNFATNLKSNWFAWFAVVILTALGYIFGAWVWRPRTSVTPLARSGSVASHDSTRRTLVAQQTTATTTVEGVLVETIDDWPDGRRTTMRVFDRESASKLIDFRTFEFKRETEDR